MFWPDTPIEALALVLASLRQLEDRARKKTPPSITVSFRREAPLTTAEHVADTYGDLALMVLGEIERRRCA